MNGSDVVAGIRATWSVANDLGIAQSFTDPRPLKVNEDVRRLVLDNSTTYRSIYLGCLSRGYYNIILNDYSFMHFGCDGDDCVRYAFYPNPFVGAGGPNAGFYGECSSMFDSGEIDFEEYAQVLAEAEIDLRVPLLRYENAPSQHKPLVHPCSHLHIGRDGNNRWAVERVLTPLAFSLLVFKQYYPDEWAAKGGNPRSEFGNRFEERLAAEKASSRRLLHPVFDMIEGRSFYLT